MSLAPVSLPGSTRWPPSKPNLLFRPFRFENGKWVIPFNYRGGLHTLFLDTHDPRGKFVYARFDNGQVASFEKVSDGWLLRILLPENRISPKSLFMLHLGDQGEAALGLWDGQAFYSLDARMFLAKPHALPPVTRKGDAIRVRDLPSPFSHHAKNLAYLRALSEPLRRDWGEMEISTGTMPGSVAWKLRLRLPDYSRRETRLPLENISFQKVTETPGTFFNTWERKEEAWVGTQDVPLGPEAFGDARSARLRLTLYDFGQTVLTLEEEKISGERVVYRLDPAWLSHPKDKPVIHEIKKLPAGEPFDSVSFKNQVMQQGLGEGNSTFPLPSRFNNIQLIGDVFV